MDYDEKYFKISANKKALRMWVIIGLALTGAYIAECVKGARTVPYTVLFCFVCWVPFVFTYIFIKIKGWDYDNCKHMVAVGYFIFYFFLLFTSYYHIAFAYAFPVVSMLVLYKDRSLMIRCGVMNLIDVIVTFIKGSQPDLHMMISYPMRLCSAASYWSISVIHGQSSIWQSQTAQCSMQ